MSISPDLFLAILAMDSYNRGYGAGLGSESDGLGSASDGSNKIGQATLSYNLEDAGIAQSAQAAGFYAVAYTVNGVDGVDNGTTVISSSHTPVRPSAFLAACRGSDNVAALSNLNPFPTAPCSDSWNGSGVVFAQ
jgi:hypothetical protein